ncbi:phage baseplate assembly protein [Pseudomonas sp. Pc102]|uniref:GPW/gp25 family protein n=1 Tax=Pseudomonas sp. Pc102 TaxID=2678261 RepID=UPI001BD17C79|nr:GPW/gp25 family protein [Pseudomonas sp. Pc102]BBP86005.1 phage baseplate assembly protein [Pseudomonas sp. Pc102]
MNRVTGGTISTQDHIRQSVADILTTRLGSRVMRREYGSQLVDLIDQPGNSNTLLLAYAAIAMSLVRWEPRIRLSRIQLSAATMAGQYELTLEATLVDTNEATSLSIPLSLGAVA